jgi:saccharopine dehydrogenase (NAD+, L-lysine-forming)
MRSAAAALLARHRAEVDLVVLDAVAGRAEAVVRAVGHGEARVIDASSGDLAGALRGVAAVASCLPYRLNLAAMEAALAAGCHYADLGGLFHTTRKQLELDDRFREAGLSAVLGIGSAPGLTNVLARLGADRLDRAVSIDMVDGSVEVGVDRFSVPYSAETLIDEFTLPAMVFEDGELREVPAGSGVVDWTFPEPAGVQPAMYTLHPEVATLPTTIPGVRDVRWRLALPRAVHDGFRLFVDVGLASTEPVETPHGPAVPREVLVAVLGRMPAPEAPPPDVEYLDVRVAGEKGGRRVTHVALARFDPSPEGLSAGAFGTALPIAIAARWMAEGRVEPGVRPPETAFDAAAFVAECEREGVGLSTELREG